MQCGTIIFDESKVPKMKKAEIKSHILFCRDEIAVVNALLKEKIPLVRQKALKGWKHKLYQRLKPLKEHLR